MATGSRGTVRDRQRVPEAQTQGAVVLVCEKARDRVAGGCSAPLALGTRDQFEPVRQC